MKTKHLIPMLALACANVHADEASIVTDPSKIIESTTYDLGDRLLTVQELTPDALSVPPLPPPVAPQPAQPPRPATQRVARAFIQIGGTTYRQEGQPARSLITYHPQGGSGPVTFWSSADWSLLAGVRELTDSSGKIWQQMCMITSVDLDRQNSRLQPRERPPIPSFPAGRATYQIISGTPAAGAMAPVQLFLSYYDDHLAELQAAFQQRAAEQARRVAEEKAHPPIPEDIFVQYRIMAPEEIVKPETTQTTPSN